MTSTSVFIAVRQQLKSKEKANKKARIKALKAEIKFKGSKLLEKIALANVHLNAH